MLTELHCSCNLYNLILYLQIFQAALQKADETRQSVMLFAIVIIFVLCHALRIILNVNTLFRYFRMVLLSISYSLNNSDDELLHIELSGLVRRVILFQFTLLAWTLYEHLSTMDVLESLYG